MERPILLETATTILLTIYVITAILMLRKLYETLIRRGWVPSSASYLIRKLVHLLAAGPVTLAIPFLYESPLLPSLVAIVMGLILWERKRRGKVMSWFQTSDNNNEITFILAWGTSILLLWRLTGDLSLAILPAAYISLGDGVTGLARVALRGRREKHWSGNLAMFTVTLPIGVIVAGLPGAVSALASSIAEKFQMKYLDDNITITGITVAILALAFTP